jgi:monothiol glutaredoxin
MSKSPEKRGNPMDVLDRIDQQVKNNPIVIYMKGTPQFPMCGFSMRAAAALQECGIPFAYINVLQDPEIFENLPRYADWPTFPQIYIDGELIGGCDITLELHANGELKNMMEEAAAKTAKGGSDAA